jgi:hypothetical protein
VHRQPQPPREAAHLIETLARAIGYAHEHGIVHRDLKPANVLMTANGIPKISDFGLAKRLEEDSSQTKSGTLLGTPSYMSPEQARGETRNVGPLADIYSLGAMLYELLTGRPPFQAATPMDTMIRVTREEPVAPSRLQANIPRDIETICLKCLQKEPAKRYATAEALAEDLRRFLSGEPILARPISAPERAWRWCKRNPWVAASSAAIFVLLLAVAIGSTYAAIKIGAEKNRAEQNERIAKENEKVANDQANLALQAFGTLINEVQQKLGKAPGMQVLKRALLQTAVDGLKRVAGTGAIEGKMLLNNEDAFRQMAEIALEFGKSREAYEYYERYYDLTSKALESQPENALFKARLSRACMALGQLSGAVYGDKANELKYYERALELRKESVATSLLRKRRAEPEPQDWVEPFVSCFPSATRSWVFIITASATRPRPKPPFSNRSVYVKNC